MFDSLAKTTDTFKEWSQVEPLVNDLLDRNLDSDNYRTWLSDWTRLAEFMRERLTRLQVATSVDTTDEVAKQAYLSYLEDIFPNAVKASQQLGEKLLRSGVQPPDDFEIPFRDIQTQVKLFREENVPIQAELQKLERGYDEIVGAQTVEWEGEERTIKQLQPLYDDQDQSVRERAWRLGQQRILQDRAALNALWVKMFDLRQKMAHNAGFDNFRDYQWETLLRFDYTPDDCLAFHAAIEEVVVPAAERIHEKRREQLGLATLRPWDLDVDPLGRAPLRPFKATDDLERKCETIFNQVDPELGQHFATMRRERLLDLDNRKGKAPGGYCTSFDIEKRPFIFMNAVGLHSDVQTLLHEAGHSFHVFESAHLPYFQQREVPMEFAEVASMAMELVTAPYLTGDSDGFYTAENAARARIQHLEEIIMFWPYMAVVDAFQHWAYMHSDEARDPAKCDAKWLELWGRFMKGVDWGGLEEEAMTGWHRKLHIFVVPFYYIEYGLAQLGAIQVWQRALENQARAIQDYRHALSLGGTASLPELYTAAGARFAFDAQTLREAVDLAEETIQALS